MSSKVEKKQSNKKYFLYFFIILALTSFSLVVSLWGQFDEVASAIATADLGYFLLMMGIVFLSYFLDALIIKIFCRLYTRNYSYGKAFATSMVGQFFSDVTPGASGGQIMQSYTLKNQGIPIASAASIFVMAFIIYQASLITFDIVALAVELEKVVSIASIRITDNFSIPMAPIIVFGFALNLGVTSMIYLLSYSKTFHKFILHTVIGFLGKIKLIKDPDKAREDLRISIENYKVEFKRLRSNIAVTIAIFILDLLILFLRNSIPYFAGLALSGFANEGFDVAKLFDSAFLGAFHQMVTGLLPLPGGAGVSEYFFEVLFYNFYDAGIDTRVTISSAQILWRFSTFHIMLLISGLFVAFYRNKPRESLSVANRKTFVNLQIETYDERKHSSDSMYETAALSRKAIRERITNKKGNQELQTRAKNKVKVNSEPLKKSDNINDDWESIDIKL